MRIKLLIFVLILGFNSYAKGKAQSERELEKVAAGIKEEAMLLYRFERASWLASDIIAPIFQDSVSSIKGYFSYWDERGTKCVFFNGEDEPMVIATITFDIAFSNNGTKADLNRRPLTPKEKEIFSLRKATYELLASDTTFKFYNNANFNVVPIVTDTRRDVYAISASQQQGVLLLGNDYLMKFDKHNKLVSNTPLHSTIIPFEYPAPVDSSTGDLHIHYPENSPYISPTDICTAMLYKDVTGHNAYSTVSEDYICIWHCNTQTLTILLKPKK